MPEMGIPGFAADFNSLHAHRIILFPDHMTGIDGFGKTGPAGIGLKFIGGTEQRFSGHHVYINTFPFVIVIRIMERAFGGIILGDVALQGSEFLLDLGFGRFFIFSGIGFSPHLLQEIITATGLAVAVVFIRLLQIIVLFRLLNRGKLVKFDDPGDNRSFKDARFFQIGFGIALIRSTI